MEESNAKSDATFKPPYLPFKTFWSFIGELSAKPLPPEIDRSLLRSKSGTDQAQLIAALKSFELITEAQVVQDKLRDLCAANDADAKSILATMLWTYYGAQLTLSGQSATEKQLNDSFEEHFGVNGDTRRKVVTFFLQAARFAGMPLSLHFPVTRLGSGRPAGTRPKSTTQRKPPTTLSTGTAKGTALRAEGKRLDISFGDAGSVTLFVDVSWLDLPMEQLTAIRAAIQAIQDLADTSTRGGEL